MSQIVTAVFDAPPAADAAVQDLEVARFPWASIRRGTDAEQHLLVTVEVSDLYIDAVTGILEQCGATEIRAA
jgi:hypothetical protein